MDVDLKVADAAIVPAGPAAGFQESPVLPRVCVRPARALYIGPGLDLAPHINLAVTIAVAWQQPFALRTWARAGGWTDWRDCEAAVVPSASLHHLRSAGPMAFLYLDPLQDRRNPLTLPELLAGRARLRDAGSGVRIDAAFAAFGLDRRVPTDARIANVVREVERRPEAFARLRDAAALAHLSSAFKRVFGLSASSLLALGATIDLSGDDVLPAGRLSARLPAPSAAT